MTLPLFGKAKQDFIDLVWKEFDKLHSKIKVPKIKCSCGKEVLNTPTTSLNSLNK